MSNEPAPGTTLQEEAPFPLTDVDKWILSQTDEEFKRHDWEDLKEIISELPINEHALCSLQSCEVHRSRN